MLHLRLVVRGWGFDTRKCYCGGAPGVPFGWYACFTVYYRVPHGDFLDPLPTGQHRWWWHARSFYGKTFHMEA